MFKILATENTTNHKGQLHNGFVNVDGVDLTFESFAAAFEFLSNSNDDFLSQFNSFQIVNV